MSELLQDVQFSDNDSKEETNRKLRILQDELTRVSKLVGQLSFSEDGTLNFGQVALNNAASPGLYPVPTNAAGFIECTINGVPARIALFLP